MLQQDEPDDYVIATGEEHSVREFVELAFERAGLDLEKHVVQSTRASCGRPRSTTSSATRRRRGASSGGRRGRASSELVELMVDADLERVGNELAWANRP